MLYVGECECRTWRIRKEERSFIGLSEARQCFAYGRILEMKEGKTQSHLLTRNLTAFNKRTFTKASSSSNLERN
jgi:hypothetical protein